MLALGTVGSVGSSVYTSTECSEAGTGTVTATGAGSVSAEWYLAVQAALSGVLWGAAGMGALDVCGCVLMLKLGAGIGGWVLPSLYATQPAAGIVGASLASYVLAWSLLDAWGAALGAGVGSLENTTSTLLVTTSTHATTPTTGIVASIGMSIGTEGILGGVSGLISVLLLVGCAWSMGELWRRERAGMYAFLALSSALLVSLLACLLLIHACAMGVAVTV